jgi:hypothetical protein
MKPMKLITLDKRFKKKYRERIKARSHNQNLWWRIRFGENEVDKDGKNHGRLFTMEWIERSNGIIKGLMTSLIFVIDF